MKKVILKYLPYPLLEVRRQIFTMRLRWGKYPKIVRLKVGSMECKISVADRLEERVAMNFLTEEPLFEAFIQDIRENDVVFDIGAGFGVYSAFSSKIAKITYAFECFPARAKKVINQFVANSATHKGVSMVVALSDYDGTTQIHYDRLDIYSPSLRSSIPMLTKKMTVVSTKIDSLIASGICKSPDVMKIDVEGAELLVLKGAETLFHNAPPARFLSRFILIISRTLVFLWNKCFNFLKDITTLSETKQSEKMNCWFSTPLRISNHGGR